LAGVAVKWTGVPAQEGFCDALIVTLTGRFGLTVIVMEFEVAGLLEIQAVNEEVRMQLTTSPLFGA
jgi:hypothetical protein